MLQENSNEQQSLLGNSERMYSDNAKLIRLLRWFTVVDVLMIGFQVIGFLLVASQASGIPDNCDQIHKLFTPYMWSFAVTLVYLLVNIWTVRTSKNTLLKAFTILVFIGAFGSKVYFVIITVIKRNKNLGMCFFQPSQNLFFVVEGILEILCLLVTLYLSYSLQEMVFSRKLSGKIHLLKLFKKIQ